MRRFCQSYRIVFVLLLGILMVLADFGNIKSAFAINECPGVSDYIETGANSKSCDGRTVENIGWVISAVGVFGSKWVAAAGVAIAGVSSDTRRECEDSVERVRNAFKTARKKAEDNRIFPGYALNTVHSWTIQGWQGKGLLIQDFRCGKDGYGDGAIIASVFGGLSIKKFASSFLTEYPAQYIGGKEWEAFKRATNTYRVFPGLPANIRHQWDAWTPIYLQDFRGGTWGDGAIIEDPARKTAELVAGIFWKAYIKVDGRKSLGVPKTFVYDYKEPYQYKMNGKLTTMYLNWKKQDFAQGSILVDTAGTSGEIRFPKQPSMNKKFTVIKDGTVTSNTTIK